MTKSVKIRLNKCELRFKRADLWFACAYKVNEMNIILHIKVNETLTLASSCAIILMEDCEAGKEDSSCMQ